MRTTLITVMLVAFATLNAMDSLCCPDGCTHEQESPVAQHSPESADGVCMLCFGGIDSPRQPQLLCGAIATIRVAPMQLTPRLDAPTDPLEHPPRF